jgi:hypothetical protein
MDGTAGVRVVTHDLAGIVDPGCLGKNGAGDINRAEGKGACPGRRDNA